jgi:hypothetical protein
VLWPSISWATTPWPVTMSLVELGTVTAIRQWRLTGTSAMRPIGPTRKRARRRYWRNNSMWWCFLWSTLFQFFKLLCSSNHQLKLTIFLLT